MDDEEKFSTRRVSAAEMSQLHELLEQASQIREVSIDVTPETSARVLSLIPKMDLEDGSSSELLFAMAVRQIFMAGLYQLESELEDE